MLQLLDPGSGGTLLLEITCIIVTVYSGLCSLALAYAGAASFTTFIPLWKSQ
jgi:hypothetical protein